jgi:2-keto-4-pentenoate hydratase/2-oxohepta-3-ene-1,7-dioic acid hydratase in catechol pathway
MKVATFSVGGERRVGLVDLDRGTVAPFDIPAHEAADGVVAVIRRDGTPPATLSPYPLDRVALEAPVPLPHRNIFCIGKNYHEHAREFSRSGFDSSAAAGDVPKHPIIFSKVPESVIPNAATVTIDPRVSTAIDYEAELAVIIGKPGKRIAPENAFDHVWGYTIINDVTARDLQARHSQWLVAKSQDTFCPMGPWAVSKDELDISDTAIRCFVNGDMRQNSNTGLLIFDIPTIIATISEGVTLRTGDVIATGTPAGVGIGFDPPRYLKDGDRVRIEIEGIGVLENPVKEVRP